MEIQVLGTGSSGNCYRISKGKSSFLIECGMNINTIKRIINYKLSQVDFCIITHEHMDHAKACKELMKSGIDLYMSRGTAEALGLGGHRLHTFEGVEENGVKVYEEFEVGSYKIRPFATIHDVAEPVGYLIKDREESLVFVTDTAYMIYKIPRADYLMIECNYVKSRLDERVRAGAINVSLRNRIVKNHMGLETLVEALKIADLSGCKGLYVLHLSSDNSDEDLIKKTLQEVTGVEVIIA